MRGQSGGAGLSVNALLIVEIVFIGYGLCFPVIQRDLRNYVLLGIAALAAVGLMHSAWVSGGKFTELEKEFGSATRRREIARSVLFWVWSAKTQSRTRGREEVFVMQSAEDRIGTDCVGFPVAMARTGLLVVTPRGRRIGNTRTQRHVRAPGIVMGDPGFQNGSQMPCGERDQPIQTLSPDRTDEAFADRIGHRASRRGLQHLDSEFFHRFVEVPGKDAVAIV